MYELMTIAIVDGELRGIGTLPYKQVPRIGEWIDILLEDNKLLVHEVVMVMYGTTKEHESHGESCEIYVKRLGPRSSVLRTLG